MYDMVDCPERLDEVVMTDMVDMCDPALDE